MSSLMCIITCEPEDGLDLENLSGNTSFIKIWLERRVLYFNTYRHLE
jgi:hypothetical protein